MKDEEQLDQFLAKSKDPQWAPTPSETPTEERVVEEKARQSKQPLRTTVLQRKNILDEQGIERNISSTLRKHPDLDETELRKAIAKRLEDQDDQLSEADYAQIVHSKLKAKEQAQDEQKQATVEPPPVVDRIAQGTSEQVGRLADWASGLQTPGGVGLLVGVLIFFVWVIVPVGVDGKTRMQLLWGVLTGQVSVSHDEEAIGGSGGGDFGDGSATNNNGGIDVANARQFVPSTITYLPTFEV